jgi:L-fucose isomerase-like protein
MDMDPLTVKGVWGFNGTERPGAVYLASVLATHAQKGLPAFGIYGHDVQEADDKEIPEDVKAKLLLFGRAAVAAATMRGQELSADRLRHDGDRRFHHQPGIYRGIPGYARGIRR